MEFKLQFLACETCGAIDAVFVDGEPAVDSRDGHAAWHERLRKEVGRAGGPFGIPRLTGDPQDI